MTNLYINFAYAYTSRDEIIDFCFLVGEPLLEFKFIKLITKIVKAHQYPYVTYYYEYLLKGSNYTANG